jgi:hypothetical protein
MHSLFAFLPVRVQSEYCEKLAAMGSPVAGSERHCRHRRIYDYRQDSGFDRKRQFGRTCGRRETKDAAVPEVPVPVRERRSRRARLPPMQALLDVAGRQIGTRPTVSGNIIHDEKESVMRRKTKKIRDAGRRDDAGRASAPSGRPSSKPGRCPVNPNSAGNTQKTHERYMNLARAAEMTGDAAGIENLYQHADHYFRLMRAQAV